MESVLHVRAFKDNYIWLVRGTAPDRVAIVDPGDAAPVLPFLREQGLRPVAVLCTHHHGDHVGGVEDILDEYSIPVYGPANEHIPRRTHALREGDRVSLPDLQLEFSILDIPCHTAGHIAYFGNGILFCGDTLFSAGCGRLFEGTAEQMHHSLSKLAVLPEDTRVYCGHEYTVANLRFALAVDDGNTDVKTYLTEAEQQQARGQPTLPSTIGLERRVNPFLRAGLSALRQAAERHEGRPFDSEVAVFASLRRWKDGFRA
jgi:hydroxyacylglutathione hydrolase